MLDFAYDSKPSHAAQPAHELRPARALLTPTWIAALALLVANDHWFKGSGMLPDLLTGKLSDFAGMLVAPVLLAVLLRVRTRRALLACHVAVALVFAGIQLAPSFAAQWSALMGLFGPAWVITCDPTDLIALPFLLLSWALLVPEMDASKPAMIPMQRTAVACLSVFGLWSTVATSQDRGFGDGEWYFDVDGNVYINNANDFAISLHVRPLRDDLRINCDEIALDPGRLLTQDAFGEAEHWELPAWTTVGVLFDSNYNCGAAWVAGEGIPPIIVFADSSEYTRQGFPGQVFAEVDEDLGRAGLGVVFGETGGTWIGNDALRFTPKTDAPELPAVCEAPSGEHRLDWPLAVPPRAVEVLALTAGVDGCHELEVQELTTVGGEVLAHGQPYPFYLCAPDSALPFAIGERLDLEQTFSNSSGQRQLSVTLLDNETLAVATNDGVAIRRVHYLRGAQNPADIGAALKRELVAVPKVGCPWQIEAGCATVERSTDLAFSGEDAFLEAGVPVTLTGADLGSATITAMVSFARQRALVDQSCSDGALRLNYDIDFVVIEEPLP